MKNGTRKSEKKLFMLKKKTYNVGTINSITYRSYEVPEVDISIKTNLHFFYEEKTRRITKEFTR